MNNDNINDLSDYISQVKLLLTKNNISEAYNMITDKMKELPDRAESHNLMGILYELINEHSKAMKHFRASYSLNPTYLPARENLERYGTMVKNRKPCFNEGD